MSQSTVWIPIINLFFNDANQLLCIKRLNRKCAYSWRLDEIWGTRPNNTAVSLHETTILPDTQTQLKPLPPEIMYAHEWDPSDIETSNNENDMDSLQYIAGAVVQISMATSTSLSNRQTRQKSSTFYSWSNNCEASTDILNGLQEILKDINRQRRERKKRPLKTQLEISRIQADSNKRILRMYSEMMEHLVSQLSKKE